MTQYVDAPPGGRNPSHEQQASAWVGWIGFAGVLMMILGTVHAFQGLVALFKDEYFVVSSRGLAVKLDYTAWGWVHLVLGIVAVLSGVGLLAGNLAARIVGVGVAFLSALVNLAFISAYPVWSSIIIVIDVIVIFAIIVHGSELKDDYR